MTGPEINLPPFTKADALEAARLGLTQAEYAERQRGQRVSFRGSARPVRRDPDPTSNRRNKATPKSGGRMEVSESEYREMCLVAALARRFMPYLEQTVAPVALHSEFEGLREALDRIELFGWATTGTERAVGDLLNILDATR